jgi:hypothetical protein
MTQDGVGFIADGLDAGGAGGNVSIDEEDAIERGDFFR